MLIKTKEPATPLMIDKIGPYTVFVTPPPTPKPSSESRNLSPPVKSAAPPVIPPPVQYEKSGSGYHSSKFGFFWDVVEKSKTRIRVWMIMWHVGKGPLVLLKSKRVNWSF